MKVELAHPFRVITEGELYVPSIIAFARVPYEATRKGNIDKITKYHYFLYINLWLITFTFKWIK